MGEGKADCTEVKMKRQMFKDFMFVGFIHTLFWGTPLFWGSGYQSSFNNSEAFSDYVCAPVIKIAEEAVLVFWL